MVARTDENVKSAIGLDWQKKNNAARASRSFLHFFAIVVQLQCETA